MGIPRIEDAPNARGLSYRDLFRLASLAVVIFGGLLVLQGSSTLDTPKLVYMFVAGAALLGALTQLYRERTAVLADALVRPWLWVALAFAGLVAISLPVALFHGTPVTLWLRDAAAYAMFAAAPVFAAFARHLPRRLLVSPLIVSGLLAATSFSIEWIQRRGIADLPIDRLVLPTGLLAATFLAYASARAIINRRWLPWAVAGGVVLGLFFVTATRSTLLLLAVPVSIAVLARPGLRRASAVIATELSLALSVLLLAVVLTARPPTTVKPPDGTAGGTPPGSPAASAPAGSAAPSAGPGSPAPSAPAVSPVASGAPSPSLSVTPRPEVIGDRFGDLGEVFSNPASDGSFRERIAQTLAAGGVFLANPIAGTGPGTPVSWVSSDGEPQSSYTLDTPLLFLAKFGLLGLAALVLLLVVFWRSVGELARRERGSAEHFAFVGFGVAFTIAGLLNSPFEDKGLSFATILILAIVFRPVRKELPPAAIT